MKNTLIMPLLIFIIISSVSPVQSQTESFIYDGNTRSYTVFLPNNYNDSSNFPLVIYLHSYGWNVEQGMNYTKLYQATDTTGFVLVCPHAMRNWNSGIGDNPRWRVPDVDDVSFIDALIDTLINNYRIDTERIYACGLSNGGFMSYKVACRLSNRIAAIASVGGVMSSNNLIGCAPERPVPVLQIHGTADTWVPMKGAEGWESVDRTLSSWINNNNCVQADTTILPDLDKSDSCFVEKISFTNCANNCNITYYKIINGGHTWPGAGPAGYPAGNTNQDINANAVILNFFNKWKLGTKNEQN